MHLCPIENKNISSGVISVTKTPESLITDIPLMQEVTLHSNSDVKSDQECENLAFQILSLVLDSDAAFCLSPYFYSDVIETMQGDHLCYLLPVSEIIDWVERNLNKLDVGTIRKPVSANLISNFSLNNPYSKE